MTEYWRDESGYETGWRAGAADIIFVLAERGESMALEALANALDAQSLETAAREAPQSAKLMADSAKAAREALAKNAGFSPAARRFPAMSFN